MTQNGTVTKLLDNGRAAVAVERSTACGGNCGGCEACVFDSHLFVEAENAICAKPGERVVLESETKHVLGAVLLVYMLPVALFFAGLGLGVALSLSQGLCVVLSLAGAALGGALAVLIGRRRKEITFRITGYSR